MTLRKTATKPRQRWALLIGAVAALTLVIAGVTLAVHGEDFQLDGDVLASTTTTIGGSTQTVDWDSLIDSTGTPKTSLPDGFDEVGFQRDFRTNPGCSLTGTGTFCTKDQTTFATGSKDTLPISGWQCNFDNNVNSKIDVMNAYAATYVDPDNGDEIIYFGLERNTNTGDANVAFWFLQAPVGCTSTGGAQDFTGGHTDGDLLVVSAFSGGGTVSSVDVYRWVGDDATGHLDTTPVFTGGVDCRTTSLPATDSACGAANRAAITTPWLTASKLDGVGNDLRTALFFEGGLNLTKEDLGGKCFNTFIGDTRSSTSLTATLFDFAGGQLGECESSIVTTPVQPGEEPEDPPVPITSEPIPATGQLTVMDSALITVNGADEFEATVTFYLCREAELVNADGDPDPDGTCAIGGTQIGTAKDVTTSPSTVVSDAAGLTAAERYCWRADFSGDEGAGVPADSDSSSSECFVVTPLQPTLTTTASAGVTLGSPIYDTISLTGTADQPGTNGIGPGGTINATNRADANGTISVIAYGPDDPTCTTEAVGNPAVDWPVTITVSGYSTTYGGAGSVTQFTPTAVGQYTFVASYSGDSPNTLGAGPSACDDANEQVTVTGAAALVTRQRWLPNDAAQITSPAGTTLAGMSCSRSTTMVPAASVGYFPVHGDHRRHNGHGCCQQQEGFNEQRHIPRHRK